MNAPSEQAAGFDWLLGNFVTSVPGVRHSFAVSADGLLMARSSGLDRSAADRLSAIVSGLASLTRGGARELRAGAVRQTIVEMDEMFLFTTNISDGSVLAVAAEASCDVGLVGYEMTLLVARAEAAMTPQLVAEMRARRPVVGAGAVGEGG